MRKVGETSETELLSLKASYHNKKICSNSERKRSSRRGEFRFFFTRNAVSRLLEVSMRKVGETSETELLSLKTLYHNKQIYTNSERHHLSRRGEFRFFFTCNAVSRLLEVSMRKHGETSETELLSLKTLYNNTKQNAPTLSANACAGAEISIFLHMQRGKQVTRSANVQSR